jgi:hypothetical protein
VPQLIEELMDASIRFVYFSRVNEQRTKLFADKLGLETDWNCCISLQEHALSPGPSSEIAPTSPGGTIEKLPHGIEKIKRHIREVDNVPLLVKMFSDATPQNTTEMVMFDTCHLSCRTPLTDTCHRLTSCSRTARSVSCSAVLCSCSIRTRSWQQVRLFLDLLPGT